MVGRGGLLVITTRRRWSYAPSVVETTSTRRPLFDDDRSPRQVPSRCGRRLVRAASSGEPFGLAVRHLGCRARADAARVDNRGTAATTTLTASSFITC